MLWQVNGVNFMNNNHIDDRKQQISHRISDLIFLLNELEKNNKFTYPNGTTHYFEYRLAQYQQVEYPDDK